MEQLNLFFNNLSKRRNIMENKSTLIKYIVAYIILGLVVFISGCKDSVNAPDINSSTTTTDPAVFET